MSLKAIAFQLNLKIGVALGSLCLWSLPVYAQEVCAPQLTLPGTIQTQAYDPFAQTALIDDSELVVQDASCASLGTIDATIGWGTSAPRLLYNGQELAFSLSLAGRDLTSGLNSLSQTNSPSSGTTIDLPAQTSGSQTQQVRVVIPEGQIVSPGLYRIDIPGIVGSASGLLSQVQGSEVVRAAPISIATQVLAAMNLAVLGCDLSLDGSADGGNTSYGFDLASTCQLNLGDPSLGIVNGASRRARLNARANVNFKIAMISRNGGVLKLVGHGGDTRETEQIRYSASLVGYGQGSVFVCGAPDCGTSEPIGPSSSPLGTDLYFQVRVTDPEIAQKRAGKYADTITLIIQPAS